MLQNWLTLLYSFVMFANFIMSYSNTLFMQHLWHNCQLQHFPSILSSPSYLHHYTVRCLNIWWLADFCHLLPRSAHLTLYGISLCLE